MGSRGKEKGLKGFILQALSFSLHNSDNCPCFPLEEYARFPYTLLKRKKGFNIDEEKYLD